MTDNFNISGTKNNLHQDSNLQNLHNLHNLPAPLFENLSLGTLRRYQSFFNLKNENKDLDSVGKSKNEILNLIKSHFNNFEIDSEKVIENFMKIEKDQNNEKNNSLRKSIRFQEKNMAKFLDNFNTYNTK
jgi:hypothetical protein